MLRAQSCLTTGDARSPPMRCQNSPERSAATAGAPDAHDASIASTVIYARLDKARLRAAIGA